MSKQRYESSWDVKQRNKNKIRWMLHHGVDVNTDEWSDQSRRDFKGILARLEQLKERETS